ncbi:MAG: sigma-70 family RNA polymerase sigma factor [Sphingobacterium sp.]|jgi:RNA polymerase sigma-70 factor (ECF subfamily)|uniref:RNA polymerase sigma factor n=1 Tax=Sphingobacterium sp. TaxID=341027 RepID=UPI002849743A|nr:sigma-70 family RNA polymerase sigma factor [Sphingobacterium sp.]MDR3011400.1 sigma-70 family RNA polymerase sigma factor [Sphingobacterium sp.]
MEQLDDTELFAGIQANDRHAFSELVNRYSAILFRFIQRRVSCIEDSEDILQEVFVSLWNNRHKINIEYSLYPYLFKAAKYKIIDWTIQEQRKVARAEALLQTYQTQSTTATSEEELLAKELSALIEQEIDKMPTSMKSAFSLSRKESMSIKDIATELALSEQTVKNNISLALGWLKLRFK